MSRLTAAAAMLALLAAPIVAVAPAVTADAATPSHNVLRGFCANIDPAHHRRTDCVADASDDLRTLAFRDERGHLRRYTSARAALAFLRHHSRPCAQEDSRSCYWDAGTRGNGTGDTFLSVGRTTVYLIDVTTRP